MNYLGYDAFSPLYSSYLDSSYLHKKIHLFIKVDKNRYPAQYRGYYGTFSGVVDDDDETVLITGNDMTENYADTPVSTVKNRKPPYLGTKEIRVKKDDIVAIYNDNFIKIYESTKGGKRRNKSRKQRKSKKQRKSRKHNKK